MKLTLHVGTKNWSTWSLRGWLPLKLAGLPFEEKLVPLRRDTTSDAVKKVSPSGWVPVLDVDEGHRQFRIWDSLAIAEFVAEIAPAANLWPEDRAQRAKARAICAEMHSGFQALRQQFSMEFARHLPGQTPTDDTAKAIARIQAIWTECLTESGGPYLFGAHFGNADVFYAPVVSRFHTYDVRPDGKAGEYLKRVWSHPLMREWLKAAGEEVAQGVV